jgi:hypothetical protein
MNIGFDISQTGVEQGRLRIFTHAMIKAMLAIAPQHRYALYRASRLLLTQNANLELYRGEQVSYGPRHLTRRPRGFSVRLSWTPPSAIPTLSTLTLLGAGATHSAG